MTDITVSRELLRKVLKQLEHEAIYSNNGHLITKVRAALEQCPCKDRPATECPGEWEPGCDLGNNEAHCKPAPVQEPMFWVRLRSDGMYEGPIHNAQIEKVRKESGGWTPLYTAQPRK